MKGIHCSILFFMLILASSCVFDKDGKVAYVQSPDTMYSEAIKFYNSKLYQDAIEKLDEIQRLYPFTKYSEQSQVFAAYTNFIIKDFTNAAIIAMSYIENYPNADYSEYMHYLNAMSYYSQVTDPARSQSFTKSAYKAFNLLLQNYPEGVYADDARVKLAELYENLALKQLYVGRYYLSIGNYMAAIKRLNVLVNEYGNSVYCPEGMYRMTEAYDALSIKKERDKYAAILVKQFPESVWRNKVESKFLKEKLSK